MFWNSNFFYVAAEWVFCFILQMQTKCYELVVKLTRSFLRCMERLQVTPSLICLIFLVYSRACNIFYFYFLIFKKISFKIVFFFYVSMEWVIFFMFLIQSEYSELVVKLTGNFLLWKNCWNLWWVTFTFGLKWCMERLQVSPIYLIFLVYS